MYLVKGSLDAIARRPLAACVASLFALAAPAAFAAANLPVTSCLDDGSPGTLRSVIAGAANGDTVDLSGLTCANSTITLVTGGSHITVGHDITISGPATGFTIDGSQLDSYVVNYSNVFYHTSAGILALQYLTVTGGHESHRSVPGVGGCIYSTGGVLLIDSRVTGCTANSQYDVAKGGGIYAKNGVGLWGTSSVDSNTATGASASGGGIFSGGIVETKYKAGVIGNTAKGASTSQGGGIFAQGNVYTTNGTLEVSLNYAQATSGNASGGGIFTNGGLSVSKSQIKYNTAKGTVNTSGAGAYVVGDLYLGYTTVTKNSLSGGSAYGGGLHTSGNVTIMASTISRNTTTGSFGGIDAFTLSPAGKTFMLRNSTVSSNSATVSSGGIYSDLATNKFYNSTIAFNSAGSSQGTVLSASIGPISALLQSTLMSNNTSGSNESDLNLVNSGSVTFDPASSGNLVRATFYSIPGTANLFCPLLGPLRDNGGRTQTHQLLSHSPVIDSGNNVLGLNWDQRGSSTNNGTPASYPRVLGPVGQINPHADIGAYELDQADVIFNTSFETCVPLI